MMELEIFVMVDSEGQYEVGCTDDEATERYADNIADKLPRRLVKVVLNVPCPTIPVLTGTVPAEGEAGLKLEAA